MDFKNPVQMTPASENLAAESFHDDLKIDTQEEEEITTDTSDKDKQKKELKQGVKKRRPVSSDSVRFLYESNLNFKKALRDSKNSIQQEKMNALKEKIQHNFSKELKQELMQALCL